MTRKTIVFILFLILLFISGIIYDSSIKNNLCNNLNETEFNTWWEDNHRSLNVSQDLFCDLVGINSDNNENTEKDK